MVLADGECFVPFAPSRDHKRVFDADRGPNTGGMGAYSCDDMLSADLEERILATIVRPALAGIAREALPYRGFLYCGLMLTSSGPKVLEFNCRLGDPETQPLMARMDADLAELLSAAADGRLDPTRVSWKPGASLCVVMTSGGYPGEFETGHEITGIDDAEAIPGVTVFHAGTKREGARYYTCSGRVLGVNATGPSIETARRTAYQAVQKICFAGAHYRTDIALSAERAKVAGD
jgi:phosphoribosylamine--glycine ligase